MQDPLIILDVFRGQMTQEVFNKFQKNHNLVLSCAFKYDTPPLDTRFNF